MGMRRHSKIALSTCHSDSGRKLRMTAVAVPRAFPANVADASRHTIRDSTPTDASEFNVYPIGVLAIVVPSCAAVALAPRPAQNTEFAPPTNPPAQAVPAPQAQPAYFPASYQFEHASTPPSIPHVRLRSLVE